MLGGMKVDSCSPAWTFNVAVYSSDYADICGFSYTKHLFNVNAAYKTAVDHVQASRKTLLSTRKAITSFEFHFFPYKHSGKTLRTVACIPIHRKVFFYRFAKACLIVLAILSPLVQ